MPTTPPVEPAAPVDPMQSPDFQQAMVSAIANVLGSKILTEGNKAKEYADPESED